MCVFKKMNLRIHENAAILAHVPPLLPDVIKAFYSEPFTFTSFLCV